MAGNQQGLPPGCLTSSADITEGGPDARPLGGPQEGQIPLGPTSC